MLVWQMKALISLSSCISQMFLAGFVSTWSIWSQQDFISFSVVSDIKIVGRRMEALKALDVG